MIKEWKLFIDDERMPVHPDFIIARNSYDAIWMINNYGFPIEIAFDHDLGGQDTAMRVVAYLEELVYIKEVKLPKNFTYTVHSQNPIGKKNIIIAMNKLIDWSSNI